MDKKAPQYTNPIGSWDQKYAPREMSRERHSDRDTLSSSSDLLERVNNTLSCVQNEQPCRTFLENLRNLLEDPLVKDMVPKFKEHVFTLITEMKNMKNHVSLGNFLPTIMQYAQQLYTYNSLMDSERGTKDYFEFVSLLLLEYLKTHFLPCKINGDETEQRMSDVIVTYLYYNEGAVMDLLFRLTFWVENSLTKSHTHSENLFKLISQLYTSVVVKNRHYVAARFTNLSLLNYIRAFLLFKVLKHLEAECNSAGEATEIRVDIRIDPKIEDLVLNRLPIHTELEPVLGLLSRVFPETKLSLLRDKMRQFLTTHDYYIFERIAGLLDFEQQHASYIDLKGNFNMKAIQQKRVRYNKSCKLLSRFNDLVLRKFVDPENCTEFMTKQGSRKDWSYKFTRHCSVLKQTSSENRTRLDKTQLFMNGNQDSPVYRALESGRMDDLQSFAESALKNSACDSTLDKVKKRRSPQFEELMDKQNQSYHNKSIEIKKAIFESKPVLFGRKFEGECQSSNLIPNSSVFGTSFGRSFSSVPLKPESMLLCKLRNVVSPKVEQRSNEMNKLIDQVSNELQKLVLKEELIKPSRMSMFLSSLRVSHVEDQTNLKTNAKFNFPSTSTLPQCSNPLNRLNALNPWNKSAESLFTSSNSETNLFLSTNLERRIRPKSFEELSNLNIVTPQRDEKVKETPVSVIVPNTETNCRRIRNIEHISNANDKHLEPSCSRQSSQLNVTLFRIPRTLRPEIITKTPTAVDTATGKQLNVIITPHTFGTILKEPTDVNKVSCSEVSPIVTLDPSDTLEDAERLMDVIEEVVVTDEDLMNSVLEDVDTYQPAPEETSDLNTEILNPNMNQIQFNNEHDYAHKLYRTDDIEQPANSKNSQFGDNDTATSEPDSTVVQSNVENVQSSDDSKKTFIPRQDLRIQTEQKLETLRLIHQKHESIEKDKEVMSEGRKSKDPALLQVTSPVYSALDGQQTCEPDLQNNSTPRSSMNNEECVYQASILNAHVIQKPTSITVERRNQPFDVNKECFDNSAEPYRAHSNLMDTMLVPSVANIANEIAQLAENFEKTDSQSTELGSYCTSTLLGQEAKNNYAEIEPDDLVAHFSEGTIEDIKSNHKNSLHQLVLKETNEQRSLSSIFSSESKNMLDSIPQRTVPELLQVEVINVAEKDTCVSSAINIEDQTKKTDSAVDTQVHVKEAFYKEILSNTDKNNGHNHSIDEETQTTETIFQNTFLNENHLREKSDKGVLHEKTTCEEFDKAFVMSEKEHSPEKLERKKDCKEKMNMRNHTNDSQHQVADLNSKGDPNNETIEPSLYEEVTTGFPIELKSPSVVVKNTESSNSNTNSSKDHLHQTIVKEKETLIVPEVIAYEQTPEFATNNIVESTEIASIGPESTADNDAPEIVVPKVLRTYTRKSVKLKDKTKIILQNEIVRLNKISIENNEKSTEICDTRVPGNNTILLDPLLKEHCSSSSNQTFTSQNDVTHVEVSACAQSDKLSTIAVCETLSNNLPKEVEVSACAQGDNLSTTAFCETLSNNLPKESKNEEHTKRTETIQNTFTTQDIIDSNTSLASPEQTFDNETSEQNDNCELESKILKTKDIVNEKQQIILDECANCELESEILKNKDNVNEKQQILNECANCELESNILKNKDNINEKQQILNECAVENVHSFTSNDDPNQFLLFNLSENVSKSIDQCLEISRSRKNINDNLNLSCDKRTFEHRKTSQTQKSALNSIEMKVKVSQEGKKSDNSNDSNKSIIFDDTPLKAIFDTPLKDHTPLKAIFEKTPNSLNSSKLKMLSNELKHQHRRNKRKSNSGNLKNIFNIYQNKGKISPYTSIKLPYMSSVKSQDEIITKQKMSPFSLALHSQGTDNIRKKVMNLPSAANALNTVTTRRKSNTSASSHFDVLSSAAGACITNKQDNSDSTKRKSVDTKNSSSVMDTHNNSALEINDPNTSLVFSFTKSDSASQTYEKSNQDNVTKKNVDLESLTHSKNPIVLLEDPADSNCLCEDIPLSERINDSVESTLNVYPSELNVNTVNKEVDEMDTSKKKSVNMKESSSVMETHNNFPEECNNPNTSLVFSFNTSVSGSQVFENCLKKSETKSLKPSKHPSVLHVAGDLINSSKEFSPSKVEGRISKKRKHEKDTEELIVQCPKKLETKMKLYKDPKQRKQIKEDTELGLTNKVQKLIPPDVNSIKVTAEIHNEPSKVVCSQDVKMNGNKMDNSLLHNHGIRHCDFSNLRNKEINLPEKNKSMRKTNSSDTVASKERRNIESLKCTSGKQTKKNLQKKISKMCEEIRQEIDQEGLRKLSAKDKKGLSAQEKLKKNPSTENPEPGPSAKQPEPVRKRGRPRKHSVDSTLPHNKTINNFLLQHSRKSKRKRNELQDKLNVSIGLDDHVRSILSLSQTNEFFRLNSQYEHEAVGSREEHNTCTDLKSNGSFSIKLKCDKSAAAYPGKKRKKYKSYVVQETSIPVVDDRANHNIVESFAETTKHKKRKSVDGENVIPLLTFETFDRSENEEDTSSSSYLHQHKEKDRRTSTLSTPRNSVDNYSEDETVETIEKFISTTIKGSIGNIPEVKDLNVSDSNQVTPRPSTADHDFSNLEKDTMIGALDAQVNEKSVRTSDEETRRIVEKSTTGNNSLVPTVYDSFLNEVHLDPTKELISNEKRRTGDEKTTEFDEKSTTDNSSVPNVYDSYLNTVHLETAKELVSSSEIHPVIQVRDVNFNSSEYNCNITEDTMLTPLEQHNVDLEASTESYTSSEWNMSSDSSMPTYYYEYSQTIEYCATLKQISSNEMTAIPTSESYYEKTSACCDSTSSDTNISSPSVHNRKEKDSGEEVGGSEQQVDKESTSALENEALSVFFSNFKASKEIMSEKCPNRSEAHTHSQPKQNDSNKQQTSYPKTHATIINLAKSSMLEKNRNDNINTQNTCSKKNIPRKQKSSGSFNFYNQVVDMNHKAPTLFNLVDLKSSDLVQVDSSLSVPDNFPMFLCDVNDKIVQNDEFINTAALLGTDDKLFEESSSSEVSCNENLNQLIASLSDDTNSSDTNKKKNDRSIPKQGYDSKIDMKTLDRKAETKSLPGIWYQKTNTLDSGFTIDSANSTNSRLQFDIELGLEMMDNSELRIVKSSVRSKSSNSMENSFIQDKKNIKIEQGITSTVPLSGDAKMPNTCEQQQQAYSHHHPHQQTQHEQSNQQKHAYNLHQKQRIQEQQQHQYRQSQYQEQHDKQNHFNNHQPKQQNYQQNERDYLQSMKQHKPDSNAVPWIIYNYDQTSAQCKRGETPSQNEDSCKQPSVYSQVETRNTTQFVLGQVETMHNSPPIETHQHQIYSQGRQRDHKIPVEMNSSNKSSIGERNNCSYNQQPYMNFVHQKSHQQIYNTALNPSVSPTKPAIAYSPKKFTVCTSSPHPFVTPPLRPFSTLKNPRVPREKSLLKTVHRKKLLEKQIVESKCQDINTMYTKSNETTHLGLAESQPQVTSSEQNLELRDDKLLPMCSEHNQHIVINPHAHTLRTQSIIMKGNSQNVSIVQADSISQYHSKRVDSHNSTFQHHNKRTDIQDSTSQHHSKRIDCQDSTSQHHSKRIDNQDSTSEHESQDSTSLDNSNRVDSQDSISQQSNKICRPEPSLGTRRQDTTQNTIQLSSPSLSSSEETIGPFITEHTFATDYNGIYGSNDAVTSTIPYLPSADCDSSAPEMELIQSYPNVNSAATLYYYEPVAYDSVGKKRTSVLDIPILPANRMMSIAEVLANPDCNPELQNKLKTISSSKVNM